MGSHLLPNSLVDCLNSTLSTLSITTIVGSLGASTISFLLFASCFHGLILPSEDNASYAIGALGTMPRPAQHSTTWHITVKHGTIQHGTARHGTAVFVLRHGPAQPCPPHHTILQNSTAQPPVRQYLSKSMGKMGCQAMGLLVSCCLLLLYLART